MSKVFVLECWTHETYQMRDGPGYDINVVGVFDSKEEALKFAKTKPDYAGTRNDWDWVISEYYLNEDGEYAPHPEHFNRLGEPYDTEEVVEDEDYNDSPRYDEVFEEGTKWLDSLAYVDDEYPDNLNVEGYMMAQFVNTQEDVDDFVCKLEELKPNLPHREKKTTRQRVKELQDEILRLLEEDGKEE